MRREGDVSLPRVSTKTLMAVVAIAALDFAAGRALWGYHRALLLSVVVTALAVQIGLFRLCLTRGPRRAFWAGFVAGGAAAMASLYRSAVDPPSASRSAWLGYDVFVLKQLERLPIAPVILSHRDIGASECTPFEFTGAVVLALPQLAFALVGGLAAFGVAVQPHQASADAPAHAPRA
jgi:hypothetical protein